jgi:hypothetical protein
MRLRVLCDFPETNNICESNIIYVLRYLKYTRCRSYSLNQANVRLTHPVEAFSPINGPAIGLLAVRILSSH